MKTISVDILKTPTAAPAVFGRVGDRTAFTRKVIFYNDGAPIDLTDYTINFEGTMSDGHIVVDSSGVKVIDAKNGIIQYALPFGAVSKDGGYRNAYFSLTKKDVRETTNNIDVYVYSNADISPEEADDLLSEYEKLLAELEALINGASGDISKFQKEIDDLQKQIDALETKVNDSQNKIDDAVKKGIADIEAEVNAAGTAKDSEVVHKTGNETVDGSKTYKQPIIGSLASRTATFTDFAQIAADMASYAGRWYVVKTVITNAPTSDNYWVVDVLPGVKTNGMILISNFKGQQWMTSVDYNKIIGWQQVAFNRTAESGVKFETGFSDYNDTQKVLLLRSGNTVSMYGSVKNADVIKEDGASTDGHLMFTIPVGFRPVASLTKKQASSGMNMFDISADVTGEVKLFRFGIASNIDMPANSWIVCFMTYNTKDDWSA